VNEVFQPALSDKIKEAIEGLALQKPPLPITAVCRQARRMAQDLGEEPPGYWVVYRIVSSLPDDLVTLAHQGSNGTPANTLCPWVLHSKAS